MARYVLPLADCTDPQLVGGKAAGLARLLAAGFAVPPGICVTTEAYRDALQTERVALPSVIHTMQAEPETAVTQPPDEIMNRIRTVALPRALLEELYAAMDALPRSEYGFWAVRSSATLEDTADATFAGLYRTRLGVRLEDLPDAVRECWASLRQSAARAYAARRGQQVDPAMAVVIQPLLAPRVAGVAYSGHPVTGDRRLVVINAVLGLAEPLVAGTATPDAFTVATDTAGTGRIIERSVAEKVTSRRPTTAGIAEMPVAAPDRQAPALADAEVLALARLVKSVERALAHPVDVEWAVDASGLWLLQARPIPSRPLPRPSPPSCVWSRANFKETLPDVPSPLGLSLLQQFMDTNILQHYRDLGCIIPEGLSAVRIIHGRPYINVTLFQLLMAQLGGDPAVVVEQMGGTGISPPRVGRLPPWILLRAWLLMKRRMWRARHRAMEWFAEMKAMADTALTARPCPAELLARMNLFGIRLRRDDLTFAIVSGVAEGFFMLRGLLERRIGRQWRSLLNAALQGAGDVISARQIFQLRDLADLARTDDRAAAFILEAEWDATQLRSRLAGSAFLQALDRYLEQYGHRAVGESDVMSPRFSEDPTPLLAIIRGYLLSPHGTSGTARREQASTRAHALAQIDRALGRRLHERLFFHYWYRRLVRYLTLREANRHALMYFTTAVRRLVLQLGEHYVQEGLLEGVDDMFFLEPEDLHALVDGTPRDWKSLISGRRADRRAHERHPVPDTVGDAGHDVPAPIESGTRWRGLTLSTGQATGPVRVIRSASDASAVRRGDIVVTPVIDPGMASLFGLAAGIVAEMGGILSHGAIIAREYGIPAIANLPDITRAVHDGQLITVDADRGEVFVCAPENRATEGAVS